MPDDLEIGLVPSFFNFLNIVRRGFRRMREQECLVEPETFLDDDCLFENVEKIKAKGASPEANFYRFDMHSKAALKASRLYEREMFDKVDAAWQIMRHNPIVETGYLTLALAIWTVVSLLSFGLVWTPSAASQLFGYIVPADIAGPVRLFVSFFIAMGALVPLYLVRNMLRFHCRDSNLDAYGALSSCVQNYNRKLSKAYKTCLGRIDADEGPHAADEDIEKWPKRASAWMELAMHHGKRSEIVDIYMDLNQWQNRNNYYLLSYYYLHYGFYTFYISLAAALSGLTVYWIYSHAHAREATKFNQLGIDYWCIGNLAALLFLVFVTMLGIQSALRQSYASVFDTDGSSSWRHDIDTVTDIKNQIYKDKVDIQHLKTGRVTHNR